LTKPSHEHGNQQRRRDVNPDPRHQRHVDRGRHQHGHHLAELPPFGEQLVVASVGHDRAEVDDARRQDHQSYVKGKETGFRTFRSPADPGLNATGDDDQCERCN
jgi:hypothetical protein